MPPTGTKRGTRFLTNLLATCAVIAGMSAPTFAIGTVTGHGRFERIKGVPSMGYAELYESNLFLTPRDLPYVGPSRRLGAPPGQSPTYDGFYSIDFPGGTYSILVDQPTFYVRPKVVPDVVIQDGQTTTQHVNLAIDYSTYFRDPGQWTAYDNPWYQTFTATGTSITGVVVNVAGTNATTAAIGILEDNGNPDVRNWRLLGMRYVSTTFKANTDNWVRWRSDEIPTIPGRRYAVQVTGTAGGDMKFAPYKRDKDASSYVGGQAYDSAGVAQSFDLNYVVFADNDGQRMTMNKRTNGLGALVEGNYGQRWGQTFVAHGYALAGVDLWAAGANNVWDLDFTWKVREDGPTGAEIAPQKTTKAAFQAFGAGLHGVSYCPSEVPLTPGRTYFVECNNVPGFNPYVMDNDSFPEGIAYMDNTAKPAVDLSMTIIEYTYVGTPLICVDPPNLARSARQGQNPADGSFTVRNCGAGVLNYAITSATYVHVVPAAGTAAPGQTNTHTVQYDSASLKPGLYLTSIVVADANATNSPQTVSVSLEVMPFAADFDADGDVDLADFTALQACFNGPNHATKTGCAAHADLDNDADVDLMDFSAFQACFNGPNQPPKCP